MTSLSKPFIAFFKELAANNNREWFNANKKRFEEEVKVPFEHLTGEVIAQMKKLDPGITLEVKDSVFRIYKDTRFSADKAPYKLHMAAVVSRGGRKDHSYPGLYFQIGTEGLGIAGGCWAPEKENLYKIRTAIAADPKRVRKIFDKKDFRETFGEIGEEKNKIIPKEFQQAGETVPEIYNKSFHYWAEYKSHKEILRDDLARFITGHYKTGRDFHQFLVEALYGKTK